MDDAIDAEALLAEGLNPNSRYLDDVEVEGYRMRKGSPLLHWAAVYRAPDCTEVRIAVSIESLAPIAFDGWTYCVPARDHTLRRQIVYVGGVPAPARFLFIVVCVCAFKALVDYSAFIDALAINEQTAIHVAAFVGHANIIEVKI